MRVVVVVGRNELAVCSLFGRSVFREPVGKSGTKADTGHTVTGFLGVCCAGCGAWAGWVGLALPTLGTPWAERSLVSERASKEMISYRCILLVVVLVTSFR